MEDSLPRSMGNVFAFYCFILFEEMLEVTYYCPDVNGCIMCKNLHFICWGKKLREWKVFEARLGCDYNILNLRGCKL